MTYESAIQDLALGAAIDTNSDRTEGVGAFSRRPAWHQLGVTVPNDMSVEDGLILAKMTGQVTKVPLTADVLTDDGVTTFTLPDKVALVDTDPFTGAVRYLNTVGTNYSPIQRQELGDWGHDIIGESGGAFLTSLGTFNGGRTDFMSLTLPTTVKVLGEDLHEFYLGLVNNHGQRALTAVISDIRHECRNTTTASVAGAVSRIVLPHTSGVHRRMQEARRILGITVTYIDEFEAMMNGLAATEFTDGQFESMIAFAYGDRPEESAKSGRTQWDNRMDELTSERWGATNEFAANTAYGAWNAVTAFENFGRRVDVKGEDAKAEARAAGVIAGSTDARVQKALAYVLR